MDCKYLHYRPTFAFLHSCCVPLVLGMSNWHHPPVPSEEHCRSCSILNRHSGAVELFLDNICQQPNPWPLSSRGSIKWTFPCCCARELQPTTRQKLWHEPGPVRSTAASTPGISHLCHCISQIRQHTVPAARQSFAIVCRGGDYSGITFSGGYYHVL